MRFLDIGCGKGVVLKEAAKYPFQRVDGIEIQPQLARTGQKNFKILKMENRIRCILAAVIYYNPRFLSVIEDTAEIIERNII